MPKLDCDEFICRRYLEGAGAPTIAKELGRSLSLVNGALKRRGIPMRPVGRQPGMPRLERRIATDVLEPLVSRYLGGESAKAIERSTGISKSVLIAELRRRGHEIRLQKISLPVDVVDLYQSGKSASQISREIGVSKKLILKRLKDAGSDEQTIRAHTPRYWHTSPVAGAVSVRGTWEKVYAIYLDRLFRRSLIAGWSYEPQKINLPDGRIYIPDFLISQNSGATCFHEVKGRLTQAAQSKIDGARALGFRVALLRSSFIAAVCRHEGLYCTAQS